jgi:hypothetical protein
MADFSPPLISGYVKLTRFSQIKIDKAYEDGFLSLRTAEPSLGTPTSRTLTEVGSAYYFPIFGISNTYLGSRKFSGNDSIMMRNRNIGIGGQTNPTFNVDISGSLRALEAQLTVLSASLIVPASVGTTTLSILYPSGVFINSDLTVNGNMRINNLTAESLVVTKFLSAANFFRNNEIITVLTLTGAAINTDISVTGNLTATNIFATSSINTPVLNANLINATNFNTTNMTVVCSLSVANDIYVNNIFGKIAIDPTSALVYNTNNQLTYSGTLDYTFTVHPTDKFSSDDVNVTRSPNGAYDLDQWPDNPSGAKDPGGFKPFFKSIQGVLDYVKRSGIFGNRLFIRVYGDVVNNEQRPNGVDGTTPTDRSGLYSSLRTVTGNLTSAFYSTEWLGSNYPHLTAAGLKGGEFIWSNDGNVPYGDIYGLIIETINFNQLQIIGHQNIGRFRNRNTPRNPDIAVNLGSGVTLTPHYNTGGEARDFYWGHKIMNLPPCNVSIRAYVWGGNPLSGFNTFGTQASSWKDVRTNHFVTFYPAYMDANTNMLTYMRDICLEFDSSTYINRGLFIETGYLNTMACSIACLGTSMYTDGALCLNSNQAVWRMGDYYASINPFFLARWDRRSSADIRALNVSRPDGELFDNINMMPAYGIAVIGNQMYDRPLYQPGEDPRNRKRPTLVWAETSKNTGLFTIRNGAGARLVDYGTPQRIYGYFGQHSTSIILDNSFNAPSIWHMFNNANLYTMPYYFRTNTFALSTRNVRFNNTGENPTRRVEFFDPTSLLERFNFQFCQFEGGFSYMVLNDWGLRSWTFGQVSPTIDYDYSPFASKNNNAVTPGYVFRTDGLADLSGSLFGIGAFNMIESFGSINIIGNRFLKLNTPEGLRRIENMGYGVMEDPLGGDFQPFDLDWYAESLR